MESLSQVLKEDVVEKLVNIFSDGFNTIDSKCVVMEPSLKGPLSLLSGQEIPRILAINNVTEHVELNWASLDTRCKVVLYMIRSQVKSVKQACSQIKDMHKRLGAATSSSSRLNPSNDHAPVFAICFVPKLSFVCEHILKEEGVFHYVQGRISELPIGFIPFENNLLSIEVAQTIREVKLEGDSSTLMHAAQSVLDLQALYGPILNIRVKGSMSKSVLDIMLRLVRESEDAIQQDQGLGLLSSSSSSSTTTTKKILPSRKLIHDESQIDTLVMIDRDVDWMSLLCTPLTYEALIDEVHGIRNNTCNLDSSIAEVDTNTPTEQQQQQRSQKVSVQLNSSDYLFSEIRDYSMEGNVLMKHLNERALQLKAAKDKYQATRDVAALKLLVKKIPELQREMKSLSLHINLAQSLFQVTADRHFRMQWQAERAMLEGEQRFEYLEECIARQIPFVRLLRLLCLQSVTSSGIKSQKYDQLKREILHSYGYHVQFALQNLEKLGLFKRLGVTPSIPPANARRAFKLIVGEVDPVKPKDVAYVTAGYAPLSVRLVQLAISPGWSSKVDMLKLVPGPTICDVKPPGIALGYPNVMDKSPTTSSNTGISNASSNAPLRGGKKKKFMVVFMVGGITQVEIAALRFISCQEDCPYEIIIATTKICNGNVFMNTILEE